MENPDMDFSDFCDWLRGNPEETRRSRILVGVSVADEEGLLTALGEGFERVRTGDCVAGDRFVVMPEALFRDELGDAFESVRKAGKIPVLTGLDAYLGILEKDQRRACFECLLRFANAQGEEAVVTVLRGYWPELPAVFSNPASRGNDWFVFSERAVELSHVTLLPRQIASRFDDGLVAESLGKWLNAHEKGADTGREARIAARFNAGPMPGLDPATVHQIPDGRTFLAEYAGFTLPGASAKLYDWILDHTATANVESELMERFFPHGTGGIVQDVLKRLAAFSSPDEQEVFLRISRRFVAEESYFARVFQYTESRLGAFRESYLVPRKEDVLFGRAAELAKERDAAIKSWGVNHPAVQAAQEAFLREAVEFSDSELAPWTGLGLKCEEREWVRRYMAGDDKAVLQSRWLRFYLAPVGTGCAAADRYLHDYRHHKAANRVDSGICREAGKAEFPSSELQHRDDAAKQAAADPGVFCLMVDGLGAEWIPFLVSLANDHLVDVEDARCVKGNLPTETDFNCDGIKALFSATGRTDKPMALDKVLHLQEAMKPEEGFCREAEAIENEIVPKIEELLQKWQRVIVTSDHGASRLASLAYENGLSTTYKIGEGGIPAFLEPVDWRYAAKPENAMVDDTRFECPLSGKYACVRGYDRLPYGSPPTFERHGGATLEERLLPWIVFGRHFTARYEKAEKLAPQDGSAQIEQNEAFDEL